MAVVAVRERTQLLRALGPCFLCHQHSDAGTCPGRADHRPQPPDRQLAWSRAAGFPLWCRVSVTAAVSEKGHQAPEGQSLPRAGVSPARTVQTWEGVCGDSPLPAWGGLKATTVSFVSKGPAPRLPACPPAPARLLCRPLRSRSGAHQLQVHHSLSPPPHPAGVNPTI